MIVDTWYKIEDVELELATFPVPARVNGERILIFRVREGFRGVERACPHLKASLADAVLMANSTVLRCSQHNFTFKLSDGRGMNSPSYRLRVFDIKVESDAVFGRPAN